MNSPKKKEKKMEIVGGKSHSTSKRIMKDLKAPPGTGRLSLSLRFENKTGPQTLLHHQPLLFYFLIF
jgi:hypothetical protein